MIGHDHPLVLSIVNGETVQVYNAFLRLTDEIRYAYRIRDDDDALDRAERIGRDNLAASMGAAAAATAIEEIERWIETDPIHECQRARVRFRVRLARSTYERLIRERHTTVGDIPV